MFNGRFNPCNDIGSRHSSHLSSKSHYSTAIWALLISCSSPEKVLLYLIQMPGAAKEINTVHGNHKNQKRVRWTILNITNNKNSLP